MKTFTIPAYNKDDETQASASVWILIYNAVSNYPAGNVEQTKNGAEILQALDDIAVQDYAEDEATGKKTPKTKYLNTEGGRIDLQDAAFLLLEKAVNDFRMKTDRAGNPQITLSSWRTLLLYDQLIEGAAEYKAGEVPPGLEPPSDGPPNSPDVEAAPEEAAIKEA